MSKIKYIGTLTVLISLLLFSSCIKVGEYYLGLHLQPDVKDSPPLEGLNVFGVIKSGPTLDTINHFFEVHKMINMLELSDSIIVESASIEMERTLQGGDKQFYTLDYLHEGRYFNTDIDVSPGDIWKFTCMHDTFMVKSSTTVPRYPELAGEISVSESQGIGFSIVSDNSAHMYMVYVIQGENVEVRQQLPQGEDNIHFSIMPDWKILEGEILIFVFAYDRNLREYYTSSNTFFKPNAYRPPFSIVDGGYGVFGSMSSGLFMLTY
jgi:hypothetical protein